MRRRDGTARQEGIFDSDVLVSGVVWVRKEAVGDPMDRNEIGFHHRKGRAYIKASDEVVLVAWRRKRVGGDFC